MVRVNSKKIGEMLTALRIKKGKTLAEVATDLDITPSALSNYENGIRIPRDSIKIRIANYYNKSVATIFFAQDAHET